MIEWSVRGIEVLQQALVEKEYICDGPDIPGKRNLRNDRIHGCIRRNDLRADRQIYEGCAGCSRSRGGQSLGHKRRSSNRRRSDRGRLSPEYLLGVSAGSP